MLDNLEKIEKKFDELTMKLGDPEVLRDPKVLAVLAREQSQMRPLVEKIHEYRGTLQSIDDAKEMRSDVTDAETSEFLDLEIQTLSQQRDELEESVKELLITSDPNDAKDVIIEIRAAAGGDEAALFAGVLLRMYTKFSEESGWKVETMSSSPFDIGGFKDVSIEVKGEGAYSRLKYESGTHRVQRVPVTESSGRIHTSAATVAVLPAAEEVELELDLNEVRVDIFRSGGPGGQSVNTTDSAIRLTHVPTGLVVSCQDERSQLQNKERAFRILRARLYDLAISQQQAEMARTRKMQVGTGDRSGRIRTYNYPQGRVTDHRIGLTVHKLDAVLEGNLSELVEGLSAADRAEKLALVTDGEPSEQ